MSTLDSKSQNQKYADCLGVQATYESAYWSLAMAVLQWSEVEVDLEYCNYHFICTLAVTKIRILGPGCPSLVFCVNQYPSITFHLWALGHDHVGIFFDQDAKFGSDSFCDTTSDYCESKNQIRVKQFQWFNHWPARWVDTRTHNINCVIKLVDCLVMWYTGAYSVHWSAMFWSDWKQVFLKKRVMCINPLIVMHLMMMVCMPYGS